MADCIHISTMATSSSTSRHYLFKLTPPLETQEKLQATLQAAITVINIPDPQDPNASYALVTPSNHRLLQAMYPGAQFTFIPVEVTHPGRPLLQVQYPGVQSRVKTLRRPAAKELDNCSIHPTLGTDATMPQYRSGETHHYHWTTVPGGDCSPSSSPGGSPNGSRDGSPINTPLLPGRCSGIFPRPKQDEYPVPYFFYGTLAAPDRLRRVLGLTAAPEMIRATVSRGKVLTWRPYGSQRREYQALVDGDEGDMVDGWTYTVEDKEQEDKLREYEGGNYEVVRCEMSVSEMDVRKTLTFRFCGKREELCLV